MLSVLINPMFLRWVKLEIVMTNVPFISLCSLGFVFLYLFFNYFLGLFWSSGVEYFSP